MLRDAEREWDDEDVLETISAVLDEQTDPSIEFTLGALGARTVPKNLAERSRTQGARAFASAVKNRAIAKKREEQRSNAQSKASSPRKSSAAAEPSAAIEQNANPAKTENESGDAGPVKARHGKDQAASTHILVTPTHRADPLPDDPQHDVKVVESEADPGKPDRIARVPGDEDEIAQGGVSDEPREHTPKPAPATTGEEEITTDREANSTPAGGHTGMIVESKSPQNRKSTDIPCAADKTDECATPPAVQVSTTHGERNLPDSEGSILSKRQAAGASSRNAAPFVASRTSGRKRSRAEQDAHISKPVSDRSPLETRQNEVASPGAVPQRQCDNSADEGKLADHTLAPEEPELVGNSSPRLHQPEDVTMASSNAPKGETVSQEATLRSGTPGTVESSTAGVPESTIAVKKGDGAAIKSPKAAPASNGGEPLPAVPVSQSISQRNPTTPDGVESTSIDDSRTAQPLCADASPRPREATEKEGLETSGNNTVSGHEANGVKGSTHGPGSEPRRETDEKSLADGEEGSSHTSRAPPSALRRKDDVAAHGADAKVKPIADSSTAEMDVARLSPEKRHPNAVLHEVETTTPPKADGQVGIPRGRHQANDGRALPKSEPAVDDNGVEEESKCPRRTEKPGQGESSPPASPALSTEGPRVDKAPVGTSSSGQAPQPGPAPRPPTSPQRTTAPLPAPVPRPAPATESVSSGVEPGAPPVSLEIPRRLGSEHDELPLSMVQSSLRRSAAASAKHQLTEPTQSTTDHDEEDDSGRPRKRQRKLEPGLGASATEKISSSATGKAIQSSDTAKMPTGKNNDRAAQARGPGQLPAIPGRATRERRALGGSGIDGSGLSTIARTRGRRASKGLDEAELYVKDGNLFMARCYLAWRKLNEDKISMPFRIPVSTRDAPDYYTIVKKPMDLETIREQLADGTLSSPPEFLRAIRLIYRNAMQYNPLSSDVYDLALEFRERVKAEVDPVIEQWRKETGTTKGPSDDESPSDDEIERPRRTSGTQKRRRGRGGGLGAMTSRGAAKARGRGRGARKMQEAEGSERSESESEIDDDDDAAETDDNDDEISADEDGADAEDDEGDDSDAADDDLGDDAMLDDGEGARTGKSHRKGTGRYPSRRSSHGNDDENTSQDVPGSKRPGSSGQRKQGDTEDEDADETDHGDTSKKGDRSGRRRASTSSAASGGRGKARGRGRGRVAATSRGGSRPRGGRGGTASKASGASARGGSAARGRGGARAGAAGRSSVTPAPRKQRRSSRAVSSDEEDAEEIAVRRRSTGNRRRS